MWIAPPLLNLHSDLARALILSRHHMAELAAKITGQRILLQPELSFPAESAFTGMANKYSVLRFRDALLSETSEI